MPEMPAAPAPGATRAAKRNGGEGAAARKLLRILEVLGDAAEPIGLARLAADAGLPKSTAHRLLAVLAAEGWAEVHTGGAYESGPRARSLAAAIASQPLNSGIDSILGSLSSQAAQTVHLGISAGDSFIYTHKVDGPHGLSIASRPGMRQLLHSTAIGKCILAGLDDEEARAILERTGMQARTPHTHTSPGPLLAELAQIRSEGYAVDREENEANIMCLAVPVRSHGRTIGAISISAVTLLTEPSAVVSLAPKAQEAAALIEKLL
jgi:DNA-binding IclR family transcriptional regulator